LRDDRSDPKFIETIVKRGYRFIAPVKLVQCETSETVDNETPPTLAVLPLVNATQDPEVEYLVDGLTDNIINNLSSVSKVRVMAHSAVMRYKNLDVHPQKAGRELGVDAMLLGGSPLNRRDT
jgi:adenylate cyclase